MNRSLCCWFGYLRFIVYSVRSAVSILIFGFDAIPALLRNAIFNGATNLHEYMNTYMNPTHSHESNVLLQLPLMLMYIGSDL